GTTVLPEIAPMTLNGEAGAPTIVHPERRPLPEGETTVSIIPFPAAVEIAGARALPAAIGFGEGPEAAFGAFETVEALAERLFPDEALLGEGLPIACIVREGLARGVYEIGFDDTVRLTASDE